MIDSISETIKTLARQEMSSTETHTELAGEVCRVDDDGLVDVKLDDSRYGPGVSGIPIRSAIPVKSISVPTGTRCSVGFDNERLDRIAVRSFENSDSGGTVEIDIGTTRAIRIIAGNAAVTISGGGNISIEKGDATITMTSTSVTVEATDVTVLSGPTGTIKLGSLYASIPVARVGIDNVLVAGAPVPITTGAPPCRVFVP